ncbi:hypothetical protein MCETHM1_00931 [Flavobacteriaceae bacterium]|jgi:hypothetical protein
MNLKKIILCALLTVLFIYIVSVVVLLIASSGPNNQWQAFDPFYQHDIWLFVFVWSLGKWGYALMVVLWFIIFVAMYQIANKNFFINE